MSGHECYILRNRTVAASVEGGCASQVSYWAHKGDVHGCEEEEFCVSERLRFVGSSLAQQSFVSPCGLLVAGGEYSWAQRSRTTAVAAESDFRFQLQNAASILDLATYRLEDLPIANQIIPQVLPAIGNPL